MRDYDFSGWATKNNIRCSDGRTIMQNAFADDDGHTVPLVWNHQHHDANNVLGHAMLQNRQEGVYAYCKFNDTVNGQNVKKMVGNGDITSLSIYANKLKQKGANVVHGAIREVSLVLAGANPEAFIDNVIVHGEECDEGIIWMGGELSHAENEETKEQEGEKMDSEKTIKDVFDTLNEEQKTVVYALLGQVLEENQNEEIEGDDEENMKHNVFEGKDEYQGAILTHSEMETIIGDAKRFGSLKESFMAHAQDYGIESIDYLFPDIQEYKPGAPEFIKRDTGWVSKVMSSTHHSPFSRIKSTFADITADEARARGYVKGKLKKEEVFSLLKRSTVPTTIYKKQKIDRDDIIDITDFDVIAWLKSEMRLMLDEEIARAVLVGDGRLASSDDKISETNIRPVWKDEDLYTVKSRVVVPAATSDEDRAKMFIKQVIKSMKEYKGSGNPTLYTTEDILTDCLLIEDTTGRTIYDSVEKLATKLRVKEIVTVPIMENLKRQSADDNKELTLGGIIVNLQDYNIGADKGGAVSMFDDFDIDYNQQKYLIETRCSGALVKPFSAIAVEFEQQ